MAETTKELTSGEYDERHRAHPPVLTPTQHEAASRKLGFSREQEEEWHRQHPTPPVLTPAEHDALMNKLGITQDQDAKWHRQYFSPPGRDHA